MSDQTPDPFATTGDAEADPFADTPPADIAAEVEEIPTVDREGAPVAADATAPSEREAEVNPQDAPAGPPAETNEQPTEQPSPAPQPEPTPEPTPEPPAAAPEPVQEPAPAQAPEPQQQAADTGGTAADNGDKQKGKPRHYKVFYMTAQRQWTEHDLGTVTIQGVKVVTIEGESWYEARNNDHATRIAYAILGSPENGVMLWPVPRGAFKPKRVSPAPPAPERTRLVIS